jgi:hypothetical protein
MSRFKISTRVGVLALLLSVLTIFVGGLGLWGIAQSNQALQTLHAERMASTAEIGKIQALLHPATSFVGGLSGHAGRGDHSHQYGHGRDKHRLHHLDMEVL